MSDRITQDHADELRDDAIATVESNVHGVPHTSRSEDEERLAIARMVVLTGNRLLEEALNAPD